MAVVSLEDSPTDPHIVQPLRPMTHAVRKLLFGSFSFVSSPQAGNPEHITITDEWPQHNIMTVMIPQLGGRKVQIHKRIVWQFCAMWRAWETEGLLGHVLSFDGAWAPRYKRGHAGGNEAELSNHSWGTALDINASRNPLSAPPLPATVIGSTVPLVPLAEKWGFCWGGNFESRKDAMHFEVARVMPQPP